MENFETQQIGKNTNEQKEPEKKLELLDIEDITEAKEAISNAIESGTLPVVSVPIKFAEAAKNGIYPNTTWIGDKIIAGTIIRSPYLPEDEKRRVFEVNISAEQIEPRFTGSDNHFHGVVVFKGPIPADSICEIV